MCAKTKIDKLDIDYRGKMWMYYNRWISVILDCKI